MLGTFLDAARAHRSASRFGHRNFGERRHGCAVCGSRRARHAKWSVLPDTLVREWGIGARRARLYDAREGSACPNCGASGRSRALALAFLEARGETGTRPFRDALADVDGSHIAEINEAKELHRWLAELPGVRYSEYRSDRTDVPSEDLEQLSYADASLALVFCSDTLEHVPDPVRALAELARVLVPGGAALLTVPLLWHRSTRVRSERTNGELHHHCTPSYHGSRALATPQHGHLVFREFGPDLLDLFAEHFAVHTVFLDLWHNPFDCAFILRRPPHVEQPRSG